MDTTISSIMMVCSSCKKIFNTGVGLQGRGSINMTNCETQCPHCLSNQKIPDGTFTRALNGLIQYVSSSSDPYEDLRMLKVELEKISNGIEDLKGIKTAAISGFIEMIGNNIKVVGQLIELILCILGLPGVNNDNIKNVNFIITYNQYADVRIVPQGGKSAPILNPKHTVSAGNIGKLTKTGKDIVIEIEEVKYLLNDKAIDALKSGHKFIPLIQLFDRQVYLINVEGIQKSLEENGVIDYLDQEHA